MTPDSIADLLRDDGFRAGFAFGAPATAILATAALFRPRALPVAGVAVVVATLLALAAARSVPIQLVVGLAALAAAAAATRERHLLVKAVAVLPGALLVAMAVGAAEVGNVTEILWAAPLVLLATVAGGLAAADFDEAYAATGLGPVLLAVTALGVYTCGPETDQSAVLVGTTVPLALLGWPRPLASLGAPGAVPTVGLVAWIATVGGQARPGAIVGGIACLGALVIEPVVRRALRVRPLATRGGVSLRFVLLSVVGGGVVVGCARVAGLRDSARSAVAVVAIIYAGCAVVLVAAALLLPRGSRNESRGA